MSTTTMNISLPDSMKAFVEETLDKDGYGTASEYMRDLIRADQKRREEARLEAVLLQRLNEKTSDFNIEEIKAELARRLNKKK
jgi:antitoxin ParD1/3/4